MTIQQAIRSGKKFRRPIWHQDNYLVYNFPFENVLTLYSGIIRHEFYSLGADNILAEDWEIITEEQSQ